MSKKLFGDGRAGLVAELMKIVSRRTPAHSVEDIFNGDAKRKEARRRPTLAELLDPKALYLDFWRHYLTSLFEPRPPSIKKSDRKPRPKAKRRTEIVRLKTVLGYKPSSTDLARAFGLPDKFEEIYRLVDKDIEKLTRKKKKDCPPGAPILGE